MADDERRDPPSGPGSPDPRRERPALAEARRALKLELGRPDPERHRPPVSTFPLTRAAKAALELAGAKRRKRRTGAPDLPGQKTDEHPRRPPEQAGNPQPRRGGP